MRIRVCENYDEMSMEAAKIVASQIKRNTQAPKRDTIIGTTEEPMPLNEPTITSIIPHNAYKVQIMSIRTIPASIASGRSV